MYLLKSALLYLFQPFFRHKANEPSFNYARLNACSAVVVCCIEQTSDQNTLEGLWTQSKKNFGSFLIIALVRAKPAWLKEQPDTMPIDVSKFNFVGRLNKRLLKNMQDRKFDILIGVSDCQTNLFKQCLKDLPAMFKTGAVTAGSCDSFQLTCQVDNQMESLAQRLNEVITHLKKLKIQTI